MQIEECQQWRGADSMPACEFLLRHDFAIEIDDFDIPLYVDAERMKVLAEILLDVDLVEHGLLHAVAERAFVHFEKHENTTLAGFARDFELLG